MTEKSDKIEVIASHHLGKGVNGEANKPYITPDDIDTSLLVAIPRSLNREQHDIKDTDFIGVDVWNCYEVSFIDKSMNCPYTQIAKIVYSADSEYIVESKSLKLYLNSFNMVILDVNDARDRIKTDLKNLLKTEVEVSLLDSTTKRLGQLPSIELTKREKPQVRDFIGFTKLVKSQEAINIEPKYDQKFHFDHLRSNCRVTNQPDWGSVYISINGDTGIISDELHDYISSLRKENHFHEEICELIYKKLRETFNPDCIAVGCFYTRRGGIDINPIRASSQDVLETFDTGYYRISRFLSEKTLNQ